MEIARMALFSIQMLLTNKFFPNSASLVTYSVGLSEQSIGSLYLSLVLSGGESQVDLPTSTTWMTSILLIVIYGASVNNSSKLKLCRTLNSQVYTVINCLRSSLVERRSILLMSAKMNYSRKPTFQTLSAPFSKQSQRLTNSNSRSCIWV